MTKDAEPQVHDIRGSLVITDGRLLHGHQPYDGSRCSIVDFTHSSFWNSTESDRTRLEELGFPCPEERWQGSPTLQTLEDYISDAGGDPTLPPKPVGQRTRRRKDKPLQRAYKPIHNKKDSVPPPEHYDTNFPKHPNCNICDKCKTQHEQCRRKESKANVTDDIKLPEKIADSLTADHCFTAEGEHSRTRTLAPRLCLQPRPRIQTILLKALIGSWGHV